MTNPSGLRVPETLMEEMLGRLHGRLQELQEPPEQVGSYHIDGMLGRGGMGRVFLGRDGDRTVAIKTLGVAWHASGDALARLEREAVALAALQHPGICRILDWIELDGTPYIVMEYVDGETLAEKLTGNGTAGTGTIGPATWVGWIEQTARALHAAHRQGIVHRDVKPSNIMVRADGQVAVVDFGVAWFAQAPRQELTSSRLGVGTLAYMAPEQLDPRARPDARTDVWALGVTLFELLHGERPFCKEPEYELAKEIREARVPASRTCAGLRRKDVDSVLRTALSEDPAARYPSALAMAEDLLRLRMGQPVLAREQGPVQRAWLRAKRRPRLLLGVMAVALSAAAGLQAYAGALAGRNEAMHLGLEARCWNLRVEVRRLQDLDDELYPRDGVEPKTMASQLREWLDGAASVRLMVDDLEQQLEAMTPALASMARVEIGAAREFEREEVGLVRERLRYWDDDIGAYDANERWVELLRAGVLDRPQRGLVPLGPDPASGLCEFAHLRSGEPARRDATGRLVIGPATGLVFVLVPGGDFAMRQRYLPEPGARDVDDRIGQVMVRLDPFFLSKYEMTRDQWVRLATNWPLRTRTESSRSRAWSDPCVSRIAFHPHPAEAVLPVFNVGWKYCEALLQREGLQLPTEAQWEMAARGGTESDLWGDPAGFGARAMANFAGGCKWRDGDWGPMTVDSLLPNPLGFHHMAGNVWEWCRDASDGRQPIGPMREGDGLQTVPSGREDEFRADRGGSYCDPSVSVYVRNSGPLRCVWNNEGVRPARALDR